jgi:predicted ribosome quality control (RQC) complex YloA/Tae2 family protein
MKISLDLTKSVEKNAEVYYKKAKKSKKKLDGAEKALLFSKDKLIKIEKGMVKQEKKIQQQRKPKRKKVWFEKFRWFYTSEGFHVIAGRDATTNEIIIKKHTDKEDIVFHSELPGSPFAVIKTEGKKPGKISLEEVAQFTACYSKAWKSGRGLADIFYVTPDQVTKTTKSGEYIGKGSFMVYGKKEFITPELKLFIGKMDNGMVMSGPETAVKEHCKKYLEIIQGKEKTSAIAKKIKAKLDIDDLDDIIKVIPVGSKLR